eukprot:8751919-Alexandrium_andersonii.AAC.1
MAAAQAISKDPAFRKHLLSQQGDVGQALRLLLGKESQAGGAALGRACASTDPIMAFSIQADAPRERDLGRPLERR